MSGPDTSAGEARHTGELLLGVNELRTWFDSREGTVRAVDGVSFDLHRGETLGIAGESGCGKSVTAQSIMRLVPRNGRIVSGSIVLHRPGGPVDLTGLAAGGREIRAIRGAEISLVFQEPMAAFSPVYTIGNQITEVIRLHQRCSSRQARRRAIDMLQQVGMPKPEQTIDAYPWAVSGGMRQRAMIAMAMACRPSLLIADEPTTAVDVTIQAQVLELMKALQEQLQMGLIIITHDLAVIAELCDRVMVMYLGRDVESGPVEQVFEAPRHPYTVALLNSVPVLGDGHDQRIEAIGGSVPSPLAAPPGCPFHPRCPHATAGVCDGVYPQARDVGPEHLVSCYLYE
ncbi:MAG: ABC transporter ATP-binding protein [Spirochaetaceae bacterium]|nr:ABC transporter ATP-binding protein [Spirochaetaceae bacterium]